MRGSSSASSTGLPRGPVAALVLILAASLQLQRAPAAAQTASQAQQGSAHPFRLWLDQRYFAPNELFYVRAEVAKASPALQIAGAETLFTQSHGSEEAPCACRVCPRRAQTQARRASTARAAGGGGRAAAAPLQPAGSQSRLGTAAGLAILACLSVYACRRGAAGE